MLNVDELTRAAELYDEFFRTHYQKNPSDINTPEKANFLVQKGFESIRLMQAARKEQHEFTKRSYWDQHQPGPLPC